MKKIMKVNGMMCAGCEKRVNNALNSLEGVVSCHASAQSNTVEIEFDEAVVALEDVKETIEEVGYEVAE